MRQKLTGLALCSAVIMVTALFHAGRVSATTPSGFVGTTVGKSTLGAFDVSNRVVLPSTTGRDDDPKVWISKQKTKGASDLYIQSNVWQPGGTTGWHSHPGHSLIIVTLGTITDYESDDPACSPKVYTQGMSFVDSGGAHAHVVRNEGTDIAQAIAVQLIPAGGTRRIDLATVPANCPSTIQ
jgi:predicted metal-dependent enzyme (double-stranded beta helix superfamily)